MHPKTGRTKDGKSNEIVILSGGEAAARDRTNAYSFAAVDEVSPDCLQRGVSLRLQMAPSALAGSLGGLAPSSG